MKFSKNQIAKAILGALSIAGIITVAVLTPGALMAVGLMHKQFKALNGRQMRQSLRKLEKNKLISISYKNGQTIIEITKEGKKKLLSYNLDDLKIKKQNKWDKKWRIVIFDIPEQYKSSRLMFQVKLKELGFKLLQKSVWVCPYPCENEIDFLKEIYLVRNYVRVVTAENIDIQADLVKYFRLHL